MFRIILLASILVLAEAELFDKFEGCARFFKSKGFECIKKGMPKTNVFGMHSKQDDSLMECFALINKTENYLCPVATCVANKKGYISADGSIDKKTIANILEKDFEKEPNLLQSVKEICLIDDPHFKKDDSSCEIVSIQMCVHIQMLQNVGDWDDEGKCKGQQETAEECVQDMSQFIYE